MDKFLGKFAPHTYALMRIVAGFLFLAHGAQKVLGMFGAEAKAVGSFMWFGGLIELVGGVLIMVGFQTAWAAFLCSGTMAVAYFMFHHKLSAVLPIQNKGELAALYSFVFLFMAAKGSGIWSVDALMGKKGED